MIAELVEAPIEALENLILSTGYAELLPNNIFSDGVYIRAVSMKANEPLLIGHKHKTRHLNVVMTGKAVVSQNGVATVVQAPDVFESQAGVRKSLYILEDMIWLTIHPNSGKEEFSQELEDRLITKSTNHKLYEKERDSLWSVG